MEQSGNIPVFNIPGTLFRNIPRNFVGNFSEYTRKISRKCSTNILGTYICPVGSEIIKNETKEQKGGFLSMLFGTLGGKSIRKYVSRQRSYKSRRRNS